MVRIAILEDNAQCRKSLQSYLKKYAEENQAQFDLTCYDNGMDFVCREDEKQFDLIFMDISMPYMNGMEVARKMRADGDDTFLIFITSLAQYAIQGYEVDALDFMVKPVGYFNFSLKLRKALQKLAVKQVRPKIPIQTRDGVQMIELNQISYIEVQQHNLILYTDLGELTIRGTLKEMEGQLSGYGFARCSNSYLVNLNRVTFIANGQAKIQDGSEDGVWLTISRRCKSAFESSLVTYLGKGGSALC
ncbi:MAG: LytTR family DNA-binding domain-containing protein [Clostridiales bacterium]|nr:LytTR family DNA-binding domain-containing protein [Clostridiales bacterium]